MAIDLAMRTLVVLNPTAGGGSSDVGQLEAIVAGRPDWTLTFTDAQGEAKKCAQNALRDGFERVVAAGGDGTISEVVQGLALDLPNARLGIIPLGTGNDLARTLDIPNDPALAVQRLDEGRERRIDLVRVEGGGQLRYCVNVCAGGFSGQVDEVLTEEKKAAWGPFAYVVGALEVVPDLTDYDTRMVLDDGTEERVEALNIVVANARTCAGGLSVAPYADVEDGLMDVVVIRSGSLLDLAGLAIRLAAGTLLQSESATHHLARRVRIASKPGMWFNVDGELLTNEPTSFTVLPQVLSVVVGPDYRREPHVEARVTLIEPT